MAFVFVLWLCSGSWLFTWRKFPCLLTARPKTNLRPKKTNIYHRRPSFAPLKTPEKDGARAPCGGLRNKRPGLLGRSPCKGVAIGAASRGGGLCGERALRVPPLCSLPVSHACRPHVASLVVGRWRVRSACACAYWCGDACGERKRKVCRWRVSAEEEQKPETRKKLRACCKAWIPKSGTVPVGAQRLVLLRL